MEEKGCRFTVRRLEMTSRKKQKQTDKLKAAFLDKLEDYTLIKVYFLERVKQHGILLLLNYFAVQVPLSAT